MNAASTTIPLPPDIAAQFDRLATATGRSRQHLMTEALREYAARELDEMAALEASIAAADRGELVELEALREESAAMLVGRGLSAERQSSLGEAVDRELRAAYGLPQGG